ncbi:MAG: hypothetical protein ACRCXE_03090 [Metamycoplasmataceae bacterium]
MTKIGIVNKMLKIIIGQFTKNDPTQLLSVHQKYPARICRNNFTIQHTINIIENINNLDDLLHFCKFI